MRAKNTRRSFIKGAAAGLVGALLALRGAEPTQAASGELPVQQIRISLREVDPRLSESDQARYEFLESLEEPTDEEVEERQALIQEIMRLGQLGIIRQSESLVEVFSRARVRPGNAVVVSYPILQNGFTVWGDALVVRLRTGIKPMLEFHTRRFEEQRYTYEEQFGVYPG
jgi:hypothetical protein